MCFLIVANYLECIHFNRIYLQKLFILINLYSK